MKDARTFLTVGLIVFVTLALAAIPATRDEVHWQFARGRDTSTAYAGYLTSWPQGRHVELAQIFCDQRGWSDATTQRTIQSFLKYLQAHPNGDRNSEALLELEKLRWKDAAANNTAASYQIFVDAHPNGKFAAEAMVRLFEIRDDNAWVEATTQASISSFNRYLQENSDGKYSTDAQNAIQLLVWDDATATNSLQSLQEYLDSYPEGIYSREAKVKLAELREANAHAILSSLAIRDITSLFDEKKIEIQLNGRDIQSITVRVRRLVKEPIRMRIPVGTCFLSFKQSVQDMVTTEESKLDITTDDWFELRPSVACANRTKSIPKREDSFRLQLSPSDPELVALIRQLDVAKAWPDVRQAAVWIVTDNASFDELGILRHGMVLNGSPIINLDAERVIDAVDTAYALQICEQAGIQIKRKAIWRDRGRIYDCCSDGELKNWLKSNGGD